MKFFGYVAVRSGVMLLVWFILHQVPWVKLDLNHARFFEGEVSNLSCRVYKGVIGLKLTISEQNGKTLHFDTAIRRPGYICSDELLKSFWGKKASSYYIENSVLELIIGNMVLTEKEEEIERIEDKKPYDRTVNLMMLIFFMGMVFSYKFKKG